MTLSCAAPAVAQDLSLGLPIDCALGETCYIQNYVDRDPTEAAVNFRCGALTYDGHKGTDFGLYSLTDMDAGVNVIASAAGTVRGVRNDMRDVLFTPELADEISGRDCGNGVVIAHGNGWETQYCHLKEGSVTVRTGDLVDTGDILGQVGLSGRTQFPHVHISVRKDGAVVDPFAPDQAAICSTTPSPQTLWEDPIPTPSGGLMAIGFSDAVPDYQAVKAGTAGVSVLSADQPIVLWAFGFGAREGDVVTLLIDGPDGELFETSDVLNRQQALFMRAGGLNTPDAGWPAGVYRATASHSRDDLILTTLSARITLP